ncbi:MAG: SpoIIE family protein phosphatase [Actinomycetota bacterium]|nr:SpoIIE family protein phosphatase [Actinomycetota bacterium]
MTADEQVQAALDHAGLLDQLADAVVVADSSMRIRYVNAAVGPLLGWPVQDLVGERLTRIVPERLRPAHDAGFRRFLDTRVPVLVGGPPVRVPALRADGDEVMIELTLSAATAREAGSELLLVAALRDVTDRVELERQVDLGRYLRASMQVAAALQKAETVEEALPSVLPALGQELDWELAVLWHADPLTQALRCLDIWQVGDAIGHSEFRELTRRMTLAQGVGLPGRCWAEGYPRVVEAVAEGLLSERAEAATRCGLGSAVAFPLLGGSGILGVVELFAVGTRVVDPDLLEVLASIGRQLGQFLERMDAEAEIRRSEARYRSLVEATATDVWRADADGRLKGDMPRWRAITGQSVDDLRTDGWLRMVADGDRERVLATIGTALADGQPYEVEFRLQAVAGEQRVMHVRGVPIVDQGELREWIGTTLDITETRRAHAAQLALADSLQRSLLPPHLPDVPGLSLATVYQAGGDGLEVGGDFYDVFAVSPSTWDAAIGDVCGKGAEAATVTALARYTLRAAAIHEESPAAVLRLLNAALLRQETDRPFLTAAYLRIRLAAGRPSVTLSAGGHPLPLLLRADGRVEPVGRPGTLLGVLDAVKLHDVTIELGSGDTLVLYTDGVTEARDEAGREFGEAGLAVALRASAGDSAEQIARRVEDTVTAFRGGANRDDLALLVLQVR